MARNGKTDRHEIPSNRLHALYAASGGVLSMDAIATDSLPADVKECDFSVEGGERFRFESLAFGSMRMERTWAPAVLDRLRTVAHMVAGVLVRRRIEHELRAALADVQQ